MSLTHANGARNAFADLITSLLEVGASAPTLVIYDSGDAAFVSLNLSDPSPFDPAVAGEIAMADVPISGVAIAGGVASYFRLNDGNGSEVLRGTVGTSGADLNLLSTTIVLSQPVEITSFTYTAPL